MDKDLKNERDPSVIPEDSRGDSNRGNREYEPSKRPSDGFDGSTGNIGEDSETESEHPREEPTERSRFAEGSRNGRYQLEN